MEFIRAIYRSVLDALFPLSEVEEELLALSPEKALSILPPAPPYDSSVIPMPGTRSVFAYKDERVSRLVWNVKYKNDAHSVAIAARALHEALKDTQTGTMLIPIPIT